MPWANISSFLSNEWETATTIARRAVVPLGRTTLGLTWAVNMRLIEYRDHWYKPREYRRQVNLRGSRRAA